MGTVGNEGFISTMDIRRVLRDFPEANNLLDDYEFDEEEIRQAMTLTVDEWNDMTPQIIDYTLENFPYRTIMIRMTVGNLLQIAAMAFNRNKLTYTAGGGSIGDQDKGPVYMQVGATLMDQARSQMRAKKTEINFDQCWGTC